MHQVSIAERSFGNGFFRLQPAVPTVSGRIQMDCLREFPIEGAVITILDLLEIPPHLVRVPGIVASELRDSGPIFAMGVNHDESVMGSTSAQCSSPRIKNSILLRDKLTILLLLREVGVMPHEKLPLHGIVFRRKSVEDGNVVVFGKAVCAWIVGIAALQRSRVAARFEQDHAVTRFSEPRG